MKFFIEILVLVIKKRCCHICTLQNELTDDREGFFTFGGSPKISKLIENS